MSVLPSTARRTVGNFNIGAFVTRAGALSVLVLCASLGTSLFLWWMLEQSYQNKAAETFAEITSVVSRQIEKRMHDHEQVLLGGVGLFNGSDQVSRSEWRRFVSTLRLDENHPGILGIGFSIWLTPAEKEKNIASVRAEGFPEYTIKPLGERPAYSSIMYLEPFNWRNQRAFGYDMYSEPVRRGAMDKAIDSGATTIAAKIILVQETEKDKQSGMLMYTPIYRKGMPTDSVELRRKAFYGFVYSPIRMNDFIYGTMAKLPPDVGFEVYASEAPAEKELMFSSIQTELNQIPTDFVPYFTKRVSLDAYGKKWCIDFKCLPSFARHLERENSRLALGSCILVSFLLSAISYLLSSTRDKALALAATMSRELTEQKVQLERLSNRFALAVDSGGIGVWEWIIPENRLIWDEWMYRLYGVRAENFAGTYEAWMGGLHPDDIERSDAAIIMALNGEREFNIEFRVVWSDGAIRTIRAFGRIERDENDTPHRMTGVSYDITSLTQTSEALASTMSLLGGTLEATMDGVLAVDLNGHISLWNQKFLDLWRVPPELLDKNISDPILAHVVAQMADPEQFLAKVRELYDNPQASSCDTLHLADGRIFLRNSQPQKVGPTIVGRVWSFNDVTDLKMAELALLQANADAVASNETLNAIILTMSDWVWEVDQEGCYTYCSPQVHKVLGYNPSEIEGNTIYDFMSSEEAEQVRSLFSEVSAHTATIKNLESWYIHKEGHQVLICTNGVPILDSDGNLTGYRGVDTDITERSRYEAEREKAIVSAEAANLAKSRFLANMSHEIRTPMNGIIGMGYLALQQDLSPKVHDYLNKITYSGEALMGILNDILDFSKIEANMLTIEEVEFSTMQLFENIATLQKIAAENKGLSLILPEEDTLPPILIGDPLRLQQVITNLINNAIKFTATGEVALSALITEVDEESNRVNILFTVQDSGIGIPPDQLDLLFQPFTQSDTSTTREYGGSGLGLSICQSLVQLMGGDISVTSTPGVGSRFSFSLWCGCTLHKGGEECLTATATMPISAGIGTPPRKPPVCFKNDEFAGVHILLVDDNAINTQLASELLERVGVSVATAANGREAVEMVADAHGAYDLVLMDVQMPVMDGLTAARTIRERWDSSRLPIVAMTAHAMAEERERCLQAGMDDLITKPVNPDALFRMVAAMTSRGDTSRAEPEPVPLPESSPLLPTVQGLDVDELLSRCMDDVTMMKRMANAFVREGAVVVDELCAAIDRDNREAATRQAHSLKGISANVGATELNRICKELEATLKGEGDAATLARFTGAVREQMEIISDVVRTLTMEDDRKVPQSNDRQGDSTATVTALRRALQRGDSSALHLVETLASQLPASLEVETLCRQVDAIDFAGALLTLDKITL